MIKSPNFNLPYNLKRKMINNDYSQYEEVSKLFEKYFARKLNGFFIEAGAFDGETYSNTLQSELNFNWTGILIEPLHENFELLKKKQRKAFILEACLDNICGIMEKPFHGSGTGGGMVLENMNEDTSLVKCVSIAGHPQKYMERTVSFFSTLNRNGARAVSGLKKTAAYFFNPLAAPPPFLFRLEKNETVH